MNKRQLNILELLYHSPLPIDIDEIINNEKVSKRTIRYDISVIKHYLIENYNISLINRRKKGYYIRPKDKIILIGLFEKREDSISNRLKELILLIAFSEKNLSIYDLSNEMYFSESTIRNVISELKDLNNLTLSITEDKHLFFENSEKEIRNILTNFMVKESFKEYKDNELFKSFNDLLKYIDLVDIENIKKIVNITNEKYNIWISNYSYSSVIHYLIITILRVKKGQFITNDIQDISLFSDEYAYSKEIINKVVGNNEEEILSFTNFIISNGVFIDSSNKIDEKFNKSIDLMIDYFSNSKIKNLNIDSLHDDISRHLGQFLKRKRIGVIENNNPLLEDIKINYPNYYEVATNGYEIFRKEMNLDYSESEISYIAIYIYKSHKEKNEKNYNVITVCGTGRGLAKLLQTRLENTFNNITVTKNLFSYHFISDNELKNVDFIVSTVKLPKLNKDVILVSSFLGKNDVRKIRDYIDYGNSIASVPFKYENSSEVIINEMDANFPNIYSNIFLKLYDSILDLPEEYNIKEEKMLGMTIHLIIAMPRIVNEEPENLDFLQEIINLEKEHPKVAKILNDFFTYLEKLLKIKLVAQEKYAFYQYIL